MARRKQGLRMSLLSALAVSVILGPLALASLQQERQQQYYQYRSPHENGPSAEAIASPHQHDGRRLEETTKYKHLKDTASDSDTASAIATFAPAGRPSNNDPAVRASPQSSLQGSAKSATGGGLSSLLNARSLQDWEVENIILLATVDGSIYARDRRTGAARWALEVDKPMVETIYHRENTSDVGNRRPEDDFLWIVEPSQDGDIYIYNQGQNGGLQRLRLTVKKLVEELSPYAGEEPAVVYTAEKKTTLYEVNVASGKITKSFSSRGSSLNDDQSCRRASGLEGLSDEECESAGTLVLGRTEYTVGIQNKDTAEAICTLHYSEWGPNNRDFDLQSQYTTAMDQKYVYSRHDGNVVAFEHRAQNRQPVYTQKFSSPVVRVFDVARPVDMQDGEGQLVVLPQPHGPMQNDETFPANRDRNKIFLNHTESGGWYAMSEMTYPLVTGNAREARCRNKEWNDFMNPLNSLPLSQRQDALVGVHSLSDFEFERNEAPFLTINGPSPGMANDSPMIIPSERPLSVPPPVLANSYIIDSAAANAADIVVALLILLCVTFLGVNRRVVIRFIRNSLELKQFSHTFDKSIDPMPSSPSTVDTISPEIVEGSTLQTVSDALGAAPDGKVEEDIHPTIAEAKEDLELPELTKERSDSTGSERGRPSKGPKVRIVEPSPSPVREDDATLASPQPGRKKARRGCRGGVKHKKKRNGLKSEESIRSEDSETLDPTVEEIMQQISSQPLPMEPDVVKVNGFVPGEVADISSPTIQIGHLRVYTDAVLGFGSHGTVVYKGSFGGRDVAVKRMLLEFYDIASHEVGLLQESDDHPNVIRYYDKESSGEFLYIALELCPASLQEVIEKPYNYPQLVGPSSLDLPDVLKQITLGVRYLHSLKIVHRDIKPQNILVAAPKKLPGNPTATQAARLLISDFGLCKKLEGDQSSFRATTAHAAGTSGWRAPELLVDDDATTSTTGPGSESNRSENTITGHSGSEPAVVDPQTNRRATRAIDIFSLGCVFYYVLTNGNHPFDRDGKYMREANIVKDKYDLSDLSSLGDYQWEAKDLVARMLSHNPLYRPDAGRVLCHPFFWNAEERLEFLCHVSDAFEFEPRDPPSRALLTLEAYGEDILNSSGSIAKGDFLHALPKEFRDTLGKQRKYQGNRLLDLLRALRNKKNHYEDMPESVKEKVGALPLGYLGFWTRRFPELLMGCHAVVLDVGWEERDRFRKYFGGV
ncbi:bifunctional endoribonuclease/protein kinase ire1 [Agyrium rufum]|nr:bifunctional endoribonuclease/protein kinase ire1 [Agyrium rufum]